MAFHARKVGWELWEEAVFIRYDFCLCCKDEVAIGEEGFQSRTGKLANRSYLCGKCAAEWKEYPGPLYKIPRFKLQ